MPELQNPKEMVMEKVRKVSNFSKKFYLQLSPTSYKNFNNDLLVFTRKKPNISL